MVIDQRVADVGEGEPPEPPHGLVRLDRSRAEVVDEGPQRRFVHRRIFTGSAGTGPLPWVAGSVASPP